MEPNINSSQEGNENYYQISDDDVDDCDELGDDMLEEIDGPVVGSGGRGPYERAWTTDATRALIHIRGPMEGRFIDGRHKRTALWLQCTRQLHNLGYKYSAAKVQKKWHNILITYNKNLSKKLMTGHVHWEFFEEMYKYLRGKKANCGTETLQHYTTQKQRQQKQQQEYQRHQSQQRHQKTPEDSNYKFSNNSDHDLLLPQLRVDENRTKQELDPLPADIFHFRGSGQIPSANIKDRNELSNTTIPDSKQLFQSHDIEEHSSWWKDYFNRKLQVEKDKIQLQKEIHRDLLQLQKHSLSQQERIERTKIEAINNLVNGLQKLVEARSNRT